MTEVQPRPIGLSATLDSGSTVYGALSEDGLATCFKFTAPDGSVTCLALSEQAIGTMVLIHARLRDEDEQADLSYEQRKAKLVGAQQAHEIKPNVPLSWMWLLEWASGLSILPRDA